jgi:hypothetical protein
VQRLGRKGDGADLPRDNAEIAHRIGREIGGDAGRARARRLEMRAAIGAEEGEVPDRRLEAVGRVLADARRTGVPTAKGAALATMRSSSSTRTLPGPVTIASMKVMCPTKSATKGVAGRR